MAYPLFAKFSISALLLGAVSGSHTLAKLTPPPPPPPSISNINQYGITDERLWTKDKAAEVRGTVNLTADREVRGLHFHDSDFSYIMQNGRTLGVGDEGILTTSFPGGIIEGGKLTSCGQYSNTLGFTLSVSSPNGLGVGAVISDNEKGKVSVTISGSHGAGVGQMGFYGSRANTFTGDVYISGNNLLSLIKDAGVAAVNGDIHIEDGAYVGLFNSNQIKDSATLYFSGAKRGVFYFARQTSKDISEKLKAMVVDGAGGVLAFEGYANPNLPHGQRHLFLDDLEVKSGSMLSVTEWEWGRDHLLVRKDSAHLQESLKRMHFEGYDPNAIHLVDYDKDYWEINALPEPAAYGAGLMLGVVRFAQYRRRRNSRRTWPEQEQ